MYKTAFKNFINNIVYIFVPMGIVYFFLLLALFWLVNALVGCTADMLNSLSEVIRLSSEQSSANVNEFLAYAFGQIDWNGNFFNTLQQILDTNWLSNTVSGFFETLSGSTEGFDEAVQAVLSDYSGAVTAHISIAVSVFSLGVTLANFLTGWLIRRNAAKRTIKKTIIAHTAVPIVHSLVIVGSTILLSFIQYYSLLVLAATIVISCGFSLTASWIIHGKGKIGLKEVLTPKNIIKHVVIVGLSFLLDAVIALLLFLISPLFALLLMIPVIIYTFAIADVNSDSYIVYLVSQKNTEAGSVPGDPSRCSE